MWSRCIALQTVNVVSVIGELCSMQVWDASPRLHMFDCKGIPTIGKVTSSFLFLSFFFNLKGNVLSVSSQGETDSLFHSWSLLLNEAASKSEIVRETPLRFSATCGEETEPDWRSRSPTFQPFTSRNDRRKHGLSFGAALYRQSNAVCQEKTVNPSSAKEWQRKRKSMTLHFLDALGVLCQETWATFSKNVIRQLAALVMGGITQGGLLQV